MTLELVDTPVTEEVVEDPTPIEEEVVVEPGKKPEEEPAETISVDDIVSGKTPTKKGVDTTPKWFKDRMGEMTAKIYEKDREIKELKEQKPIPTDRPVPPVESDFIDPKEYRDARFKYEDDSEIWRSRQRQTVESQTKQEQERAENWENYEQNAETMREKYDDFDETTTQNIFTPEMRDAIIAQENGPSIGYFLAKNPNELFRISRLPQKQMEKELWKLDSKFSLATKKIISGAPLPLNPVKGDDVVGKDPSKMTDEEWFKWDKQQKLKKLQNTK